MNPPPVLGSQRPLLDQAQNPSLSRRQSSRIQARQRSGFHYESQSTVEQGQTDHQTSTEKRSTEQSSSTTTTMNKDFGPQLQRNNIVFSRLNAQMPDDAEGVRELLNRTRESESPYRLHYNKYLVTTNGFNNEATIQHPAYSLLSKIDNHLTTGLSNAKPDISESYRKTDYPPEVVDALSSALAPSSYDVAMPALIVEVKGYNGSMRVAQLQCAYDGAIMTEGAHAVHRHIDKSDDDFCGITQALTVAYNGENLNFYGHHALQIPTLPEPAVVSTEATDDTTACLEYHHYLLSCDIPRASYEHFKEAYKHTRNAQEIGYKWATERRDALWAYTNVKNAQTSKDDPVSPQQSLRQRWTRSAAENQDSTVQILTSDNDAPPDTPVHTTITLTPTSKDIALPVEPRQLSVSATTESKGDIDSNTRNHRTTQKRTFDLVEADHKSTARKSRRKR